MLFYLQMRWNIEGRISLNDVFDLQKSEEETVAGRIKVIGMYKVAAQRRVIAIIDMENADELDRNFMARLPLREYLELEAVWALRTYESFLEDCKSGFKDTSPLEPQLVV
jgi:hypothetical protein